MFFNTLTQQYIYTAHILDITFFWINKYVIKKEREQSNILFIVIDIYITRCVKYQQIRTIIFFGQSSKFKSINDEQKRNILFKKKRKYL